MGEPYAAEQFRRGNSDPRGGVRPASGATSAAPLLLVIDPVPETTRVGLFLGERLLRTAAVKPPVSALRACRRVSEQQALRAEGIRAFLASAGVGRGRLAAAVGRGGVLRRAGCGTYLVDDSLLREQAQATSLEHESQLGAPLAHALASEHGCPAYVVDPVDASALEVLPRADGASGPLQALLTDALRMRLVARRHAASVGRTPQELRCVVAHLGGGFSLAALRGGALLDLVTTLAPAPRHHEDCVESFLAAACARPGASARSVATGVFGARRLLPCLSEARVTAALARAERGERNSFLLLQAMSYQLAKVVGELATVLEGEVDAILLTGSLSAAGPVVSGLSRRVEWIAPVFVCPAEGELRALADGGLQALSGEERPLRYPAGG